MHTTRCRYVSRPTVLTTPPRRALLTPNLLVRNVDRGGHVSALVLLDLSSAFDTVDHAILRDVLEKCFGIGGIALKFYRSYISDRTQTIQV